MTILIKVENERIMIKHYVPEMITDRTGWIEIENYQEPERREGKVAEEFYRDGQIVVEYKDIPEPEKTEEQIIIETLQEQIETLQEQIVELQTAMADMFEGGIA